MVDTIQVKFPAEMATIFDELKEVRAKNMEPTSMVSIAIDAMKAFHKMKVRK